MRRNDRYPLLFYLPLISVGVLYAPQIKQDDVVSGWVLGAASAALAVRWVTFSEAFWRGASGGDDAFGAAGHDGTPPVHSNSGFHLMMESQHGSGLDERDDDVGTDMGVLKAAAGVRGETMA